MNLSRVFLNFKQKWKPSLFFFFCSSTQKGFCNFLFIYCMHHSQQEPAMCATKSYVHGVKVTFSDPAREAVKSLAEGSINVLILACPA